ncbi:MAG: magnesium/cobalt transporter CorA [Planctomycetota bacterium]|nr:magnesium/cobalt transporter CorA [Planctomycetota bacterium]
MKKPRQHRSRQRKRMRAAPPGSMPGTLIADPNGLQPKLRVVAYGPDGVVERDLHDPHELREFFPKSEVTWLDVQGLGDAALIERLGEVFGLHRLWLEDVLSTRQRPKVENYGDIRYLVVRVLEGDAVLETDQISIFLGPRFVVTFQERYGDCFDTLRDRIRGGKGNLRSHGPSYLTYALLDAVIDHYFPVLERLGERIDALEDQLIEAPTSSSLAEIHEVRRELLTLRRAVWPLREALHHLLRDGDTAFTADTRIYLNDCYDHTVQIMDLVENYREIASGLIDVYLSSMSNRMNEVMKVLTVISTIFIPLTFVAGVYGMNFHPDAGPLSMPELRWPWGYAACLVFMAAIGISLTAWFWRKGWIFSGQPGERRHPKP